MIFGMPADRLAKGSLSCTRLGTDVIQSLARTMRRKQFGEYVVLPDSRIASLTMGTQCEREL
jgi:hypothetical protein